MSVERYSVNTFSWFGRTYPELEGIPEFVPHPALKSGHAQTVVCSVLPRKAPLVRASATPRLFTTDHDTQVLAFQSRVGDRPRPTLLLLHGMEGSSESPYMLGTGEKALAAGFDCIRLNMRNCCDTEALTPTVYNAGLTHDLRCIVRELRDRDGIEELYLGGFSLGGNVVLKFAGEFAGEFKDMLRGFVAVSPSVDLHASIDALEKRSNRFYEIHFMRSLKRRIRRKATHFPDRYDIAPLAGLWSVRRFDDIYTGPIWGYRDSSEYYEKASSRPYIRHIDHPTLIVHAKDDPFIPFEPLVHSDVSGNPLVSLLLTEKGGHVGFMSAFPENGCRRWAEARILDFLRNLARRSSLGKRSPC